MTNLLAPRAWVKQPGSRLLNMSVLLIGLLTGVSGARADTVPEWNLITANALQTAKAGTGLAHSRVYAMVHGAMFDAVNAIDRRYHPYAADLKAPPGASPDAAAVVAAHAVLMELYPQQQATLDVALAASLARVQDAQAKAVEDARVWAGIHFRSACIDGSQMGRRIAEHALKNYMRPIAK
jgi:hypothetical protein